MRSPMIYGMRAALKLSQLDVAKELNTSRATYNKKESNVDDFTVREAKQLLKKYAKTFKELYGKDITFEELFGRVI